MIIEGLKTFLKNTKVTSDRQMLSVVFNLVTKVMGSMDSFDQQLPLMNLVNAYIINVRIIDDEHL